MLVRVAWSPDYADAPPQRVDQPTQRPPGGPAAGWADLAEGLAQPSDILITKRHWGAFHGTELDLQLRRRGTRTIVLGGIATNFGVSRPRAGLGARLRCGRCRGRLRRHLGRTARVAFRFIFPRIARVARSADINLMAA